ncbi:hypothetical protein SPI_07767 [Niveomyces insectorum RCEF 264]|uniref:Succinate dehydrogenase assembly factor 4, mitochondrial n=1 Tax=Niveomyces insectorum RCEF 264 TaxID=1081102 RepID=A0A167P0L0_9HYPO|nr:hypothetical protein SPI_07767 [Niveomyces insectorum RCEF 264]
MAVLNNTAASSARASARRFLSPHPPFPLSTTPSRASFWRLVLQPTASAIVRPPTHASIRRLSSAFDDKPAPPRLPHDQQAEFERLVRQAAESAAAASLADAVEAANRAAAESKAKAASTSAQTFEKQKQPTIAPPSQLNGNPVEGVWRGAAPEFEGDRNPKTGEVGGPKNEPLRWGSDGDWSYNGRVTDF